MKTSKIRTRLKAQLLFLGFREKTNDKHWFEISKFIKNIEFIISINNIKDNIRVYTVIDNRQFDYTLKDFRLNKNSFLNISNYVDNYEHPEN